MSALICHRHYQRRMRAICIAGALLLLASAPALAQAQDGLQSIEALQRLAEDAVRRQLPASAEVRADAVDPRLRLPACAAPSAEAGASRGASVTVAVRCAAPNWTVYVPVRVRDLRKIRVLAQAVRAGDSLAPAQLTVETRDVAQLPFGYLDAEAPLDELEFRRGLVAGSALSPADLMPARCVRRGELVQLRSRIGGLEVRAGGKALGDGARGQRIRVENTQSRRVVEGTVTAAGIVEL